MEDSITVLCFGDVVGRPGRRYLSAQLRDLRDHYDADVVIVNGENASGGVGLSSDCASALFDAGADILTTGDHVWKMKDLIPLLEDPNVHCVRPANFPEGTPGLGHTVFVTPGGAKVGVLNLLGRVFMGAMVECPFAALRRYLDTVLTECDVVIIDMHSEATSEKLALARSCDGEFSLLYGTHTHTQTADEQVLPGGSGFITDLGMCGPVGGVIGMDAEVALARFLTARPHAYKIAKGNAMINGVVAKLSTAEKRCLSIERIRLFE